MTGDAKPWYRQPWVWLLALPPASTVIFWAVVLTTQARPASLVVDDYARVGLAYEQNRTRSEAAAALGVSGRLHLARDSGEVTIVLPDLTAAPDLLRVRLTHPTESSRDRRLELERGAAGLYRGNAGGPAPGRWYVQVEPPDGVWRLNAELPSHLDDLSLAPGTEG